MSGQNAFTIFFYLSFVLPGWLLATDQPSAFTLSYKFSRAERSGNLDEAKEIFARMQKGVSSDADRYMINYAETVLQIWNGNIAGAIDHYVPVSTSPLTIIGAMQRYFRSNRQHLNTQDSARHLLELDEFKQFFFRKSYSNKVFNHYQELIFASENGLWKLEYFKDDQYFYRYHDENNRDLNSERPSFFVRGQFETIEEARSKLAIDKTWSDMSQISIYHVKAPFFALRGQTSKSELFAGGAIQHLISKASLVSLIARRKSEQ